MRKHTARLLSALLIVQSIAPASFAANRGTGVEIAKPAAGPAARALSLPNTVIRAAAATTTAPLSVNAAEQVQAAAPKAALPGLEAAAEGSLSLAKPDADAADLKTGSARDFDKMVVSGGGAEVAGVLSADILRLERRSAVLSAPKSFVPAPRSISLRERAKAWMPGAAIAAGVSALAVLAHYMGSPEAAAGAPLMAAGIGAVMPAAGSNDAKLLDVVIKHFVPGDQIPTEKLVGTGALAGLSREQTLESFARLAADGRFALSSREYSILLDPSAEPQNPVLVAAFRRAITSAKRLQASGPLFRLESLTAYAEAFDQFAKSAENGSIHHRQVRALYTLTFNEAVRDLLNFAKDEAARQPNGEVAKLYKAVGPETRALEQLIQSPDSHDALVALLPHYSIGGMSGNKPAEKGLDILKRWITEAGPSDTAKTARKIETFLKDSNKGFGYKIGENERAEIAASIGAGDQEIDGALAFLAGQAWLVRVPGGDNYVTTFARARHDLDLNRDGLKDLHTVVVRGVLYANQGDIDNAAAGALTLKHALDTYREQFGERPGDYERAVIDDVQIAYKNSLLTLAHALLRSAVPLVGDATNASLHRMLQWLEANPYTKTQSPLADQVQWAARLRALIDNLPVELTMNLNDHVPHGVALLEELVGKGPSAAAPAARQAQTPKLLTARPGIQQPQAQPKPHGFVALSDKDVPNLYKYASNLTAQADKLPKVIGRDDKIDEAIEILLGKETNAPIVIGEAGVGKTALVEGVAQRIVSGDVPEQLKGKNVFKLDLKKLMAGTRYRGDAEERIELVMKEAREKGIIMFIDEIHNVLGLGGTSGGGSITLSEAMLEDLGRGTLKIIGATTLSDYRKIRSNKALNRRFGPVMLQPATVEDTITMISGRRDEYEKHHGIKITDEAIETAARMAKEYVTEQYLPASAFSLLDRTGGAMQMANFKAKKAGQPERALMASSDVEARVAKDTKIPLEKLGADQRAMLAGLEGRLKKRVIGQDEAVAALARSVKIARMGNKDPNAPPDGFVFLGPTGVGKTELAKALAVEEYNDETAFTRIDMSEYMEKHSVSKLIGTVPGYVGYDQPGALSEPVRNRPRQVILLDEIDKAHPDVLKILLQALDNGEITDGQGNKINFRNTKIIMTANFSGEHSAAPNKQYGFIHEERSTDDIGKGYLDSAKKGLPPELIGRIDERNIIVFKEHSADTLRAIAELKTTKLNKLLERKKMSVTLTERAMKHLLAENAKPEKIVYGARPIVNAIEKDMNAALTDAEIEGAIAAGDAVTADYVDGAWLITKAAK
jgi:ATP-dependent Clp protease ATP-binding subunit ClpC